MSRLDDLSARNGLPIRSVSDGAFRPYGRVLNGYDVLPLIRYLNEKTPIPSEGNVYVASDPAMEALPVACELASAFYGSMPIEIGYCNGRNTTYNGFEYHKGSEINVAASDFLLALGRVSDVAYGEDGRPTYDGGLAEVFFVPFGTVLELYGTTLHFSPLRVTDEGFRDAIILPRGTNTALSENDLERRSRAVRSGDPEALLLFQRNKWLIAHPEREPLVRQGAYTGLLGPNRELYY